MNLSIHLLEPRPVVKGQEVGHTLDRSLVCHRANTKTDNNSTSHTHTYSHLDWSSHLTSMSLDWKETKVPGRKPTHTPGIIWKLCTERPELRFKPWILLWGDSADHCTIVQPQHISLESQSLHVTIKVPNPNPNFSKLLYSTLARFEQCWRWAKTLSINHEEKKKGVCSLADSIMCLKPKKTRWIFMAS